MKVTIKHHAGKYPSFNVELRKDESSEPFLEIKGCRIANGSKGEFLSWPSTKNETTGKYWNHAYASDAFAAHVLKLAKESLPVPVVEDDDDSVPF
jgi:hypothetical protein